MNSGPRHHRADRGSRAVRLDPYAVEETTITLEEWRRATTPVARRPAATRRPRPRTARRAA